MKFISRVSLGAGGKGNFPVMKQGAMQNNDLTNIKDGCCYSYGMDGSSETGPTLSFTAMPNSTIQIKASFNGDKLLFRVKNVETKTWSNWKSILIN